MRIPAVFRLLLALLAVGIARPMAASATWPSLDSSMTADCIGAGGLCSSVAFTLDVVGTQRLAALELFNDNMGAWDFGSIQSIKSGSTVLSWVKTIVDLRGWHIDFEAAGGAGWPALEPLVMTVNMNKYGSEFLANSNSFSYSAQGLEGTSGYDPYITSGVVGAGGTGGTTTTPEPASMILLGSGIVAMGAVRRRRKQRLEAQLG